MSVILRGKTFQLRRRVLGRYKEIEPRRVIWVSLHTDSESVAKSKAELAWRHLVEGWEAKLAGCSDDASTRHEAAMELARVRGFRYLDVDVVSKLPLRELVGRVEAIDHIAGRPDELTASAFLGAMPKPEITVSQSLELYWSLARDKVLGKSGDQVRRWRNPRIKAIRNFLTVVGDKLIHTVTRDDMLDFRQYWLERIENKEVTANSANKDLIHLGTVLKTVNSMKRLNIDLPLGELSFREGETRTRPPFSVAWIKTKLLAPGALAELNPEARGLLLGMVNTGYRPSDGAGLNRLTINLDKTIPYISIVPDGRQLKSAYARRIIPLVGVSLEALRHFPDGFPRYRNSSSLSGTVNKFLKENGLLETSEHSFYSLRHAFEDRMLDAGIDDRIRRDLYGRRLDRERYWKGASLEKISKLIERIAL